MKAFKLNMKNILTFILISISIVSCGQDKHSITTKINIDSAIQKEVESRISESQYSKMSKNLLMYETELIVEYFENDSLSMSTLGQDKKLVFKSFFYNKEDTLTIDGNFGVFGGYGFSIKIIGKQAIVYHMLASDDFPAFSMNENDSLEFRIEVPCEKSKLSLSKIPESIEGEVVYGLVEFESNNYFISGPIVSSQEMEPRKKTRMNMTIYFKSRYIDLEIM